MPWTASAAVRRCTHSECLASSAGDDEDEGAAGAYERTIERLQRVKAVHDPDNVFQLNQNIKPAAGAA